jgi:hypothetical protein
MEGPMDLSWEDPVVGMEDLKIPVKEYFGLIKIFQKLKVQ